MSRSVNGQGQLRALPQTQQPAQQWGKAEGDLQVGVAGSSFIWAIKKPFPEILAQGVEGAQGAQSGDDRRLAGAFGQNYSIHPQGQAPLLTSPQVRKMVFNTLKHLITFSGIAHRPSSIGGLATYMMPEKGALSYF
jgi:hypothetical protein